MSRPARPTHFDTDGRARQVDVGSKPHSLRVAEARALVVLGAEARAALAAGRGPKGDPIEVARVAGIMAAKRTAELIPLCHQLPLSQVEIEAREVEPGLELRAVARANWTTGVEMEALTAVAVAALTVYDMLKAVERGIEIRELGLVSKSGGQHGDWQRPPNAGRQQKD